MRKFRIPYIPYRSLLLSTTVLNESTTVLNDNIGQLYTKTDIAVLTNDFLHKSSINIRMNSDLVLEYILLVTN